MNAPNSLGNTGVSTISFRDAAANDFPDLLRLTFSGLGAGDLVQTITAADAHPFHPYASSNGRILVADIDNHMAGYAATIERNGTRILSQLFVDKKLQSQGIGRQLFEMIDPRQPVTRMLFASEDSRARALYIRSGYVPAWPVYTLALNTQVLGSSQDHELDSHSTAVNRILAEIDAAVSQRTRHGDHAFWFEHTGATPYFHCRDGDVVGYSWISDPLSGGMSRWHEEGCPLHIGPVGGLTPRDSRDCVFAALATVGSVFPGRDATIEIGGPHPALPHLLRSGARILNAELAMATHVASLGDPERYVPSGGILL
jgi:GNAT superfamily N-acetyltransferase